MSLLRRLFRWFFPSRPLVDCARCGSVVKRRRKCVVCDFLLPKEQAPLALPRSGPSPQSHATTTECGLPCPCVAFVSVPHGFAHYGGCRRGNPHWADKYRGTEPGEAEWADAFAAQAHRWRHKRP